MLVIYDILSVGSLQTLQILNAREYEYILAQYYWSVYLIFISY